MFYSSPDDGWSRRSNCSAWHADFSSNVLDVFQLGTFHELGRVFYDNLIQSKTQLKSLLFGKQDKMKCLMFSF